MKTISLKPQEKFEFEKLFEEFGNKKLQRNVPYNLKIRKQKGSLTFVTKSINKPAEGEGIQIAAIPFDRWLKNDLYAFESLEGCAISFDIIQFGQIITKENS